MRDGLIIHDDADKTPPPPPGRHPLSPISGADFAQPRRRLPAQVWLLITALAALPVLLALWGVYALATDMVLRYPWLVDLLGFTLAAALLAAVIYTPLWLVTRGRIGLQHARVIRTAHGAPVDVGLALGVHPLVAEQQQLTLYHAQAPYALHPNLSTLSYGGKQAEKAEAPALPDAGLGLVPDREWVPWLGEAPHLLIAGATGAGKTTFARIALRQALEAGAAGFVIDPKGKDWYGLPVVGAGRDFAAMLAALDGVRRELEARYEAYGKGERVFPPVVVVVDEIPDIMDACRAPTGSRVVDARWILFARSLGSLAREVSIRVIGLTQSPNVEDLGINSSMRANYTRIALAEKIPLLINEDVDQARREQLRKLYGGQAHPAALWRRGAVHLLDTSNVPSLADERVARAAGWRPCVVDAPVPQDTLLKALRRAKYEKGWTRDQARQAGLRFENELWGQV